MLGRVVSYSRLRRTIPALLTVLLFTACDGRSVSAQDVAVRDSAGTLIVENQPRASASPWRLGSEPLLELGGGADGDLHAVTGLIRLDDGRIVVSEQTARLGVYNASGELVYTLGGAGAGPGEFRTITWIERLPPDSVMVYDAALSRVSIFTADGHFARSFSLLSEAAARVPPRLLGAFADGTMLGSRIIPTAPPPGGVGLVRPDLRLERIGPDGAAQDSLVVVPGDESAVLQGILAQPRFARRTHFAVGDGEFHVATSLGFEVRTYGPDGALRRIVRKPHPVLPVTDADLTTSGGRAPPFEIPEPTEFPTIANLLVGPAGSLWVEAFDKDMEAPREWFVFDPEGALLGTVAMHARFRPFEIGDDYVLGVWRDEFDVEHVRLLPLHGEPTADTARRS